MLNIWFGKKALEQEGVIRNSSSYFDSVYENSWFESKLSQDIIRGIDNTEYIGGSHFESPVLGVYLQESYLLVVSQLYYY